MDIDFQAYVEMTLNNYGDRIKAIETALAKDPAIELEADPSRPQVVKRVVPMRPDEMVVPD